jgi:hypothetical protein
VILPPLPEVDWMSDYAGPTFVVSHGDTVRLFVTGRDRHNQSRVGIVDGTLDDGRFQILEVHQDPLLDLGPTGMFDESGSSYPWLVTAGDEVFMYYVGWTAGTKTRFRNFLGLAISRDGGESFTRHSNVPILDRTDSEPYGTGSCAVWIEDDGWHMIYTAFEPWWEGSVRQNPSYRLREALSDNGKDWTQTQRIVLDFEQADEYVIGKPMILHDPDRTRLWYCYRGASYRIGYAEASNGGGFERQDAAVGLDVSDEGWDSEMVEYAFVFDHLGQRYMVYNGNQFGQTGLGLAMQVGL